MEVTLPCGEKVQICRVSLQINEEAFITEPIEDDPRYHRADDKFWELCRAPFDVELGRKTGAAAAGAAANDDDGDGERFDKAAVKHILG